MKTYSLAFIFLLLLSQSCKKETETPVNKTTTVTKEVEVFRSQSTSPAYYINSQSGNDLSNGKSPETAWKTLDRLHKEVLKPADIVRLCRGSIFKNQNIFLDNGSAGSEQSPVIIEAYGSGKNPEIIEPRALWDKTKAVSGVYIGKGTSYVTILDLTIHETGGQCGVYLTKESDHIVIAGCEIYNCGTGVRVDGMNQKLIGNNIHNIGPDGQGSGIGFEFAGSNLEFAWNSLKHCIVLLNGTKEDGSPFEYYGRRSDSDYDLSDNINIHHNTVDDCLNFIEAYGNATNMVIAFNLYKNSTASPFQFHLDDCEHAVWSHECTYEVRIENNTMIANTEPHDGGWGIVGLLVDWNHMPDPEKSKFTVRSNLFVTNHTILSWINPIGNNLIHDHNLFYFLNKGSISEKDGVWELGETEKVADPLFVDFSGQNFKLKKGSPAIGIGTSTSYKTDLAGNSILSSSSTDAGAYLYVEK